MAIFRLGESTPEVDPQAWVADDARVIGQVRLDAFASVWFGATLRGDVEAIWLGAYSNAQDSVVMHTDPGCPVTVAPYVTIGHQAVLHGCAVGEGSLVGIGAVILNGARIGRECLIGAGALVTEGKVIPDRSVVIGSPGRIVRRIGDEEAATLRDSAQRYVERVSRYRAQLSRLA